MEARLNRLAPACVLDSRAQNGRHPLTALRFGPFEYDPDAPALTRGGRRVHLQEMPLKVLEILLSQPGQLVARETFFARLWPDDELGILDDNLNTAIRKLRLALDDSAHEPLYVETVPKRGYRFVAALASEPVVAEQVAPPVQPIVTLNPKLRLVRIAAVFVTAIVIVLGTLILWNTRTDGPLGARSVTPPGVVAVLPFVNASGDANDEYFSDGLAEELMDRLSRTDRLRVISRTSAFAFKGKVIDAREIGRTLGAASLVEGSVRRDGERVRISVRLINAQDGVQLWSETYDRKLRDVFQVQEDISASIANTLTGRLSGKDSVAQSDAAIDPAAYDAYLKGRFAWHQRKEETLQAAAKHLELAAERAPNYAPAWAGLADAYAVLGFYDYLRPDEAFPKALAAAKRAIEIDPKNASAHATLGYVALYFEWNVPTAEARFLDAIARDPNLSKTHQWYGNLLTAAGRFSEAENEMRRAQQLDPLSLIASAALGWAFYYDGKHEQALEQFKLTLALDPSFELAYLWSGWSYEALGKYDDALAMYAKAGANANSTASLARVRALRGERKKAEELLAPLLASKDYVPAYEISKVYFALGKTTDAESWLRRAHEQRAHALVLLNVDPQLSRYRSNPTFARISALVTSGDFK